MEPKTNLTKYIAIIIVAIIVLGGAYVLFNRKSNNGVATHPNGTTTSPHDQTITSTSTAGTVGLQASSGTGNYKIEQVSLTEGKTAPKPIPDLSRPVISASVSGFDASTQAMVTQKITGLQAELKKNPTYLAAWIDLGMYQKMTKDYQGAVISWQYAGRLLPSNFVSFGNLGNLYAYYLHDNVQAEIYYKQAISKGPTQVYLYTQLAEVYRDVFKDVAKAKAIIDQGLVKIPNDPNLLQLKASLSASQ